MKPLILAITAITLSTAAIACGSGSAPEEPAQGTPVVATPKGDAPPVDHPPVDFGPKSASIQRLSVEQLRGTLPVAMGKDANGKDITWKLPNGKVGLTELADTLGEPDFITTTEESLEPSPLYLKFMDDAARSSCDQALTADADQANMADRTILRFVSETDTAATNAKGLDQNLRYLKLRMHGVKVADADDAAIEPLRALFTTTVTKIATGGTPDKAAVREGWSAVCVALLTAPEFHLY